MRSSVDAHSPRRMPASNSGPISAMIADEHAEAGELADHVVARPHVRAK